MGFQNAPTDFAEAADYSNADSPLLTARKVIYVVVMLELEMWKSKSSRK